MRVNDYLVVPKEGVFRVQALTSERVYETNCDMCKGFFLHPHQRSVSFLASGMANLRIRPPAAPEELHEAFQMFKVLQKKGGMGGWGKGEKLFNELLADASPRANAKVVHQLFNIDGRRSPSGFALYTAALRCLASEYAHVMHTAYVDAERLITHQLVATHNQKSKSAVT